MVLHECRHQAMLVLKGNAGTASPHNKPVRSAFPQSDEQTALHRQPPERLWVLSKLPILDSVSAYMLISTTCGMRNAEP